jgi:hypothetical protein
MFLLLLGWLISLLFRRSDYYAVERIEDEIATRAVEASSGRGWLKRFVR